MGLNQVNSRSSQVFLKFRLPICWRHQTYSSLMIVTVFKLISMLWTRDVRHVTTQKCPTLNIIISFSIYYTPLVYDIKFVPQYRDLSWWQICPSLPINMWESHSLGTIRCSIPVALPFISRSLSIISKMTHHSQVWHPQLLRTAHPLKGFNVGQPNSF